MNQNKKEEVAKLLDQITELVEQSPKKFDEILDPLSSIADTISDFKPNTEEGKKVREKILEEVSLVVKGIRGIVYHEKDIFEHNVKLIKKLLEE